MTEGVQRKTVRSAMCACMLLAFACVFVWAATAFGFGHERAEAAQADAHAQAAEGVVSVSPVPRDASSYEPGELIVGLADGGADSACNAQDVHRAIDGRPGDRDNAPERRALEDAARRILG